MRVMLEKCRERERERERECVCVCVCEQSAEFINITADVTHIYHGGS